MLRVPRAPQPACRVRLERSCHARTPVRPVRPARSRPSASACLPAAPLRTRLRLCRVMRLAPSPANTQMGSSPFQVSAPKYFFFLDSSYWKILKKYLYIFFFSFFILKEIYKNLFSLIFFNLENYFSSPHRSKKFIKFILSYSCSSFVRCKNFPKLSTTPMCYFFFPKHTTFT